MESERGELLLIFLTHPHGSDRTTREAREDRMGEVSNCEHPKAEEDEQNTPSSGVSMGPYYLSVNTSALSRALSKGPAWRRRDKKE
jgi:hypothetical protein